MISELETRAGGSRFKFKGATAAAGPGAGRRCSGTGMTLSSLPVRQAQDGSPGHRQPRLVLGMIIMILVMMSDSAQAGGPALALPGCVPVWAAAGRGHRDWQLELELS